MVLVQKPSYQRDFQETNNKCHSTRKLKGSNNQIDFTILGSSELTKDRKTTLYHDLVLQTQDKMIQEELELSWTLYQELSWGILQTKTSIYSNKSWRGTALANLLNQKNILTDLQKVEVNWNNGENTLEENPSSQQRYHKKNHMQINIDKRFDDERHMTIHVDARLVKNNKAKFVIKASLPPPTGDVFKTHQDIQIKGKGLIECTTL